LEGVPPGGRQCFLLQWSDALAAPMPLAKAGQRYYNVNVTL
jgi:hypothetical protein